MGDEWCSVILKDIIRLSDSETMAPEGGSVDERAAKLGPGFGKTKGKGSSSGGGGAGGSIPGLEGSRVGGTSGEMLWVDANTERYEEEYPALHELLTQLHALPFELNKKARLSLSIREWTITVLTSGIFLPACSCSYDVHVHCQRRHFPLVPHTNPPV